MKYKVYPYPLWEIMDDNELYEIMLQKRWYKEILRRSAFTNMDRQEFAELYRKLEGATGLTFKRLKPLIEKYRQEHQPKTKRIAKPIKPEVEACSVTIEPENKDIKLRR